MDYFEAKRNLNHIKEFKEKLARYFLEEEKAYKGNFLGPMYEKSESFEQATSEVNIEVPRIQMNLNAVGQPTYVYYAPPPAVGGIAGNVTLFTNLERRRDFGLSERVYFDVLDQAIGRYEIIIPELRKKLFNPFYWIFERGVFAFVHYLIGLIGFNYSSIENPTADKVIKIIAFITTILTLIKVILELLKMSQ